MANTKSLFVFSGEPSGDMHGGTLVRAIKEHGSNITIEGVAGPHMRAEGLTGPLDMEDFEVMGFSDVIRSLPRLYRQFYLVRDAILKKCPDAVVLIDYPGFNLRLAKALRKSGYKGKIIQYISPSVWAWGRHRIGEMASTLDMLMTIYPFEKDYFKDTSLDVQYVGSPVKEQIGRHQYKDNWKDILGLPLDRPLVALFPGSRTHEISRNLPVIMEGASMLSKSHPEALFAVSCRDESGKVLLDAMLSRFPQLKDNVVIIPKEFNYELMRDSRCAIAKSGTVTLELALHACPSVVVYKTSQLNRWYAKYVMKAILSNYCIVNILAGKEIFPELIKSGLSAQSIYRLLEPNYAETDTRNQSIRECQKLSLSLGTNNASAGAAQAVLGLIS